MAIINGTSADDTLTGTSSADTITGGAGNDTLIGEAGNDIFVFGRGHGQDTIKYSYASSSNAGSQTNVLQFAAGISASDIRTTRDGDNNLIFSIIGTTDTVTVQYFFGIGNNTPLNNYTPLQQVKFADDTIWDQKAITAQAMLGTSAKDTIYGSKLNDTIVGGLGNDTLIGDYGDDTFIFARGDGQDLIKYTYESGTIAASQTNVLQFSAGISASDIRTTRDGDNNLIFSIIGTTDTVTLEYFFGIGNNTPLNNYTPLQQVKFADGTTWDQKAITAQAMLGNAAAEVINGTKLNDTIIGGAGNDTVYGSEGDDTIMFGRGDGQDKIGYSYGSRANGNDILLFKPGVSAKDIVVTRPSNNLNNLELSIIGTNDKITIEDFYGLGNNTPDNSWSPINSIQFSDGTVWDRTFMSQASFVGTSANESFMGTAGDDFMSGAAGNDTLNSNSGNDVLNGGKGNNILIGGADDDTYDVNNTLASSFQIQRWETKVGGFWDAQKWNAGDINGDGRDDLVNIFNDNGSTSVDAHISNGAGFNVQRWETKAGGFWEAQKWSVGDFNGDGKTDLVNIFNDNGLMSADIHSSTGTGFQIRRAETKAGGFWDAQKWLTGDFNGDGKDDLANVFNDDGTTSVDTHVSNGTGFSIQRWETHAGGFWDQQKWLAADVNGDGKTDLINIFNDNGLTSVDVHVSNGAGFSIQRWETQAGGFWDTQQWTVGDVNGDGKADLVNIFNDSGSMSSDVHVNSGSGFQIQRWETKAGGFWDTQKWLNADLNGDNKSDLVNVFSDNGLTSVDAHVAKSDQFDQVIEYVGQGTDTVQSYSDFTLSANVENLTLFGSLAITGTGNNLANVITGSTAANKLYGMAGNDTLSGGVGNDTLFGGTGNDKYLFTAGDGVDTIIETDATSGNIDVLSFVSGANNDQLWFTKSGNNLEVSIIGTNNKVIVSNWYSGSANHVEQITASNGKTLSDSKVDSLISAMAAFTPPAAGQTTLPTSYQTALNSVIAASWV